MSDHDTFLDAVSRNDRVEIERLLKKAPQLVDARTSDGVTALRLAVYNGHHKTAAWIRDRGALIDLFDAAALGDAARIDGLKEAGCDVNAFAEDGWTALHLASFFGHAEAASRLLAAGADASLLASNDHGNTALHSAVAGGAAPVVAMLIAAGANVNALEVGGLTPLHLAAIESNPEMIKLLTRAGADSNLRDGDGRSPLDHARQRGDDEIIRALKP